MTYSTFSHTEIPQRRAFFTVFMIELWERFGYYGMQALIIYYMIQRLGFPDTQANLIWGAFTALLYATPAVGGWVGDMVLGARRTMMLGAVILTLGYLMMSIPTTDVRFFFVSMGVIIAGNGLFKSNAGNLVRKIYEGDDAALDSAFTLYYMAINIGSTGSMLLTPWINSYVNTHYGNDMGWHAAFAACTVGLLVGMGLYLVMHRALDQIGTLPDQRPLSPARLAGVLLGAVAVVALSVVVMQYQSIARLFVYLAGIIVLAIFGYLIARSRANMRAGLIITLILTAQVIGFYVFYQQMWTSMSLFTLRNVDWHFTLGSLSLGTWAPAQFQALNPVWIMLMSPVLAWFYTYRARHQNDFSIAAKFVAGFAVIAAGFLFCGAAAHFSDASGKVSPWVMVVSYGCCSLGELLVNGLGLAMISRYAPAQMGGFMMGAYYVAAGIAQYLGSLVANLASIPAQITDPLETLPIYTSLFQKLGMGSLGCTLLALLMLPLIHRLEKHHRTAR